MNKELDFEKIGGRIRETRIAKGLTQEYLAEYAGVNVSHISNIENNKVKVSLGALVSICNAMDVTLDYIMYSEYRKPEDALTQCVAIEVQKCDEDMKNRLLKIIKVLEDRT